MTLSSSLMSAHKLYRDCQTVCTGLGLIAAWLCLGPASVCAALSLRQVLSQQRNTGGLTGTAQDRPTHGAGNVAG